MTDAAAPGIWPILGTMNFGSQAQVKPDEVTVLLRTFISTGCTKTSSGSMVDTAGVFQQATPDGDTETVLGDIFGMYPSMQARACISTKATRFLPPHFSLSRQSVIDQCDASLEKLGLDCVDVFYLQCPDIKTDIDDTLAGVEELHDEGKISQFGLCNYPAWAVVDIWYRCKARNMLLPTVYQGMYNVVTRDLEREIVPVLRQFGLSLYVYNPLAGGILSGRYATSEEVATATAGRFSAEFDKTFGSEDKAGTVLYRSRYGKAPIFEAVELLRRACAPDAGDSSEVPAAAATVQESVVNGMKVRLEVTETKSRPQGLDMANVALRWLLHHSLLAKGDGIVLGVSKGKHLTANLGAWRAGPLDSDLVKACDAAWKTARPACESYFRGYGAQPGGIEKFLELKAQAPKTVDYAEALGENIVGSPEALHNLEMENRRQKAAKEEHESKKPRSEDTA
mmetsp:Transcript_42397/g.70275  ORF Transcript_42397/g.70275 Transcript_42397/m.70275 type:complete len:453 (-) Transcript_42397:72-1430(-)